MKPFSKAILLAVGIVLAPGFDWSFITTTPPRRWPSQTAFYNITNNLAATEFEPAIDQAASTWGATGAAWFFTPANIPVDAQYGVGDGISVIDYTTPPSDPSAPGETTVFVSDGDSTEIVEVDTTLNPNLPWFSTGYDPNSYDVQSVSTHEFGHWLELLNNPANPGDVMYGHIDPGQLKRVLTSDDIQGIQFLYPPGGSAQPGSGQTCHKVLGCRVCEPNQQGISMTVGTRKKEIIESVGEIQTLMFQKPRPRAILFAFVTDLPELEHIALNYEEEMAQAWDPVTDDWLPGLYWLSGDPVRGQDLVLTEERAAALVHGLDVIRDHSSRQLRRHIEDTRRFIRSHVGRSLEEMRSELFDEYRPFPKEHSFGAR